MGSTAIFPGNSYTDDQQAGLKADYVLANPLFNDGAKGENGWGANAFIDKQDARLRLPGETNPLPLAPRNAEHNVDSPLPRASQRPDCAAKRAARPGSSWRRASYPTAKSRASRCARRWLKAGYVDCVVTLTGKLFANTPDCLCAWFLISKNRDGGHGYRARKSEILFINAKRLGSLIAGSRKQKQLSTEEIERIAAPYRQFKRDRAPETVPSFCAVVTLPEIAAHGYALTPSRYVGTEDDNLDDEPFEDAFPRLKNRLVVELAEADGLSLRGLEKL